MQNFATRHQLVHRLRKEGMTIAKIARAVGMHPSTIKRDLKIPKATIRKRITHHPVVTSKMKKKIRTMLHGRSSMSTRLVAKQLQENKQTVSPTTVWRVAKSERLVKKKHRRTFRLASIQRQRGLHLLSRGYKSASMI